MKLVKIARRLHELGYLWSVNQGDLPELTAADAEFRDAILAIQAAHPDEYAQAVATHYGNVPEQRGKLGPAFLQLLDLPRCCPLPDVPPPAGVSFAFDDPEVQRAVESQQRAALIASDSRGSGAWPYGCWDGYEMHRLVVAVKHSSMPDHWRHEWAWLTEQCRLNYSWTGLRVDFVDWGERADVRLEFRGGGSWIGLAEFPRGQCSDEVFCYLKPTYQPSDRRYMLNLLQHELGHNNALQHTRGGIMNPTINLSDPDWRNDQHWSTLSSFYGGLGSPAILDDKQTEPEPPGDNPTRDADGAVMIEDRLYKFWFDRA